MSSNNVTGGHTSSKVTVRGAVRSQDSKCTKRFVVISCKLEVRNLVGVLYLPLPRLAAQLQLQVGSVQAERPNVVEGRNALDLAFDVHELGELGLSCW